MTGTQVTRVSACVVWALADPASSLPVGGNVPRSWLANCPGRPLVVSLLLRSSPPSLQLPLPREKVGPQGTPCSLHGPVLPWDQARSPSPCPLGSWAAGRPGPGLESAGPPASPAGPALSTACSERPFSQSRAGSAGREAGRRRGGHRGDPYLWAWLGLHPGHKDSPLEARDAGGRTGQLSPAAAEPPAGLLM